MFDLQTIIVILVIAAAAAYAATIFIRKSRAFSRKAECGDDCGCASKTKTPTAAH